MQEKSLTKRIFTSALIFIIAVAIIIGVSMGMGIVGIPLWPFIFLVLFFTSVDGSKPEKLMGTALGGFIGIFVGMSQGIFTQITGNAMVGLVLFIICVMVLGTAFFMGTVPWANVFGLLLMTIMTQFTLAPNVWAGAPAITDMTSIEAFIRIVISYALGVVLFIIVTAVMKSKAAKLENKA